MLTYVYPSAPRRCTIVSKLVDCCSPYELEYSPIAVTTFYTTGCIIIFWTCYLPTITSFKCFPTSDDFSISIIMYHCLKVNIPFTDQSTQFFIEIIDVCCKEFMNCLIEFFIRIRTLFDKFQIEFIKSESDSFRIEFCAVPVDFIWVSNVEIYIKFETAIRDGDIMKCIISIMITTRYHTFYSIHMCYFFCECFVF